VKEKYAKKLFTEIKNYYNLENLRENSIYKISRSIRYPVKYQEEF